MKNLKFLLIVLLYCSCYKAVNTNSPQGTATPKFDITVSNDYPYSLGGNIKDSIITFTVNDSSSLGIGLSFSLISGNPGNYPITCYLTSLPTSITTAQDSFALQLNRDIAFGLTVNADTGLYTININVSTTTDSLKTYPVHIHVLPVTDCSPGITGTYTGSDPCGHYSLGSVWYSYTATIASVAGQPHWVGIKNFRALGDSVTVYAFVYCGGGIDIPVQTINGYTIFGRGRGYYQANENGKIFLTISGDTIIHAGDTQTCNTQLTQN